jgi:AbrB family looped-hinge helix DNA binding protein
MPIGTVTTKGQITIPKEVRDRLGLSAGSRVNFVFDRKGGLTLKPVKTDIRSLRGIIKSPLGRPVTIEEMNEAIRRGYAGLR